MSHENANGISVIIPTYNGARFIREALESVFAQTLVPYEIVIVDNASTDGTVDVVNEILKESPVPIKLIQLERNQGFGVANNIGIQTAIDRGAEYVFLLNQDIIVQPNCISRLIEQMDTNPHYGLLSAFQLTYDGKAIDPNMRSYMPTKYWDDLVLAHPKHVYEAYFMPAAAVVLRVKTLYEVGGFDPLFFMYSEDDDLCKRLRVSVWAIGIVPDAIVWHWHTVVKVKKNMSWQYHFQYSHTLNTLKNDHRSLPIAFAKLVKRLIIPYEWRIYLARLVSIPRSLLRFRAIFRSRRERSHYFVPFRENKNPRSV